MSLIPISVEANLTNQGHFLNRRTESRGYNPVCCGGQNRHYEGDNQPTVLSTSL